MASKDQLTSQGCRTLRAAAGGVNCTVDPNNLTGKDVLIAISPLVALVTGVIFYVKGMILVSAFILVPLVVFYIYAFVKTPWEEIGEEVYEREQIQKQTWKGKIWLGFQTAVDYLSLIFFAIMIFGVGLMIYEKFFANGS